MKYSEPKLREIYIKQMTEVVTRLNSALSYIRKYSEDDSEADFDSGVLQFRKALEAVAYASIAPNKEKYQAFRAMAHGNKDFTKDFNATKIFYSLSRINENFYPLPINPATMVGEDKMHFERKGSGFLTEKGFQTIYDRLGKFLHANNPWGTNKNVQNLARDINVAIRELRSLLELHVAFIRTKSFTGAWVVEVPESGGKPKIILGEASGEFCVAAVNKQRQVGTASPPLL
ncbi:MAG: hypothetical protein COB58_04120 [Thalassobium sp.]|nr:MAG: hypothetical protein COB43_06170 [Oceanospirillales bacterium]PHQ87552.1 MAG: hypothetical protein COB58_04120 [Thalassobium sp.]